MEPDNYEVLYTVLGSAQAEILKGFLEAQGINVILSQEGIGESIFVVNVGPLGEIQLLVPGQQLEAAKIILSDYEQGKFEDLSYPLDEDMSSEG